jgi:hypothetical protein
LLDKRQLLNPLQHPLYAWQLISHKAIRYLAFVPLSGLFLVNILVADRHPFYFWFLMLQVGCYALAALGHLLRELPIRTTQIFAPYYFCVVNAACMLALLKFLAGQKMTVWKPRVGGYEYRAPSAPVVSVVREQKQGVE